MGSEYFHFISNSVTSLSVILHHLSYYLLSLVMQWNETIKLFRGGMPLRRHWAHFRCYDWSFTGSEGVEYLHELLRRNLNFGPEVTRYQTLQLLRKFLKAHVIEDIRGRHGTEDFEDNGHLYRCCSCSHTLSFLLAVADTLCTETKAQHTWRSLWDIVWFDKA